MELPNPHRSPTYRSSQRSLDLSVASDPSDPEDILRQPQQEEEGQTREIGEIQSHIRRLLDLRHRQSQAHERCRRAKQSVQEV